MRIGIDARLWNETGVGRYIRNLVLELAKQNDSFEYVLFLAKDEYDTLPLPAKNFKKVLADIRWHSLEEQLKFPQIIEKENLSLMHFPYFSVPIWYRGKFVVTIHDVILHHFPTGKASTLPTPLYWLKQVGYRAIIARAAARAAKIITPSKATAKEVEKTLHIDSKKIEVTYEGVSLSSLTQTITKEDYILYVGNAYPHKNLPFLLRAFIIVYFHHPKVKLVLVGKDDYFYKELEKYIDLYGLREAVVRKTEVSDEELQKLYQKAKALVVPSLMEGFGLPGLEAMSQKCLVLSSNIPSLKEIYQDAALYFSPKDTQVLSDLLEKVIDDKIDKTYITKGEKRVKEFSWKKMAAQTRDIYESCIGLR